MNRSALLIMFALVVAAGLFAFLQGRRTAPGDRARSPLESIDYSSVRLIESTREALPGWTMEKAGSTLVLRSPAVAEGRPVAADSALRARILGFLQDASWIDCRAEDELDLAEWGLAPPLLRVRIEDASGSHRFEIGRADLAKDIWLRDPETRLVFKYPARVFGDLGLEPRWYRDPHLADIPAHLVECIRVEPQGHATYEIRRQGLRWLVAPEGAESFHADPVVMDRLGVALANLEGRPLEARLEAAGEPLFRVSVRGNGRECHYDLLEVSPAGIVARRGGEDDLRGVDGGLARFFVADPDELEDRRLFGVEFSDLVAIDVSRPGHEDLHLARKGDYWRLLFSRLLVRPVDPEAFRGFREGVESLRSEGHRPLPADFEPVGRVQMHFDRDLEIPALELLFSAPDAAGRRLVKRSDLALAAVVGPEIATLLELDYWDLMARYLGSGNADSISELGLRDPDGNEYRLRRESEQGGSWLLTDHLRAGAPVPGFSPRVVPEEGLRGLLDRLAQLSVPRFLGERDDEELARIFAAPRYLVTWKSSELLLVPPTGPRAPRCSEWKRLEVGARLDDDHLQARVDQFPALVFVLSGNDLLPLTDALRAVAD